MKKKELTRRQCEWCQKWFESTRPSRFCKTLCRGRWHRQDKLNKELDVYYALRTALKMCVKRYPDLVDPVNKLLNDADDSPLTFYLSTD